MATHFGQIFWGLLIAIFDFRINGFDLLPDGIGFVLVAIGARGLVTLSPRFQTAATCAWIMAGLWLISFVIPPREDAGVVFAIAYMAVECVMAWMVMNGISEYTSSRHRPDLAARAKFWGRAYLVLIAIVGLISIGGKVPQELAMLVVLAVVVVLIFILRVIYLVRHEVAEREGEFAAMLTESEHESEQELT